MRKSSESYFASGKRLEHINYFLDYIRIRPAVYINDIVCGVLVDCTAFLYQFIYACAQRGTVMSGLPAGEHG
ncbi:MAG: hypothetical protein J6B62_00915, partial [Bacteroidales bacterium]|nr:hypothetical protein [Bacteroidales bacterium]